MTEYQVLARKYRPSFFGEIVGQEAIVTTLLNALRAKRTSHAYLFCGPRGCGKTSLARLLAKALNCQSPLPNGEPCNQCSSCKDILAGSALDFLEIDGASHRGIEDIRQINETLHYAPASSHYKIYLIDEVHMLTKEAFNALLKSLEEPPPTVKFFFATTEPHRIPATIVSRCQRFHLQRIHPDNITKKLSAIAKELSLSVEPDALELIATFSEGSLRDAESILDQVIAFDEVISVNSVVEALGIVPKERLFELDQAQANRDLSFPFAFAKELFDTGKNPSAFLDELIHHFRSLLFVKLGQKSNPKLQASSDLYREEQLIDLIEMLVVAQQELKHAPSVQVALEMLLVQVVRSHKQFALDELITRLESLEKKLSSPDQKAPKKRTPELQKTVAQTPPPPPKKPVPPKEEKKSVQDRKPLTAEQQSRYDTVLQFAARELEGRIKRGGGS